MSKVYHYVYKIIFETNHVYYGSRSCECLPEEDSYLGSPVTYKSYWVDYEPKKEIVAYNFESRESANIFENFCIELQWLKSKDKSLNANIAGIKFCLPCSEEEKLKKSKPFYLVSPTGEVFEGFNLNSFCKIKGLHRGFIGDLVKGKRLHYKGWTANLDLHKFYLEVYKDRGVSYCKNSKKWLVSHQNKGKSNKFRFKEKHEALSFRDEYEIKNNYKFTVKAKVKSWQEMF